MPKKIASALFILFAYGIPMAAGFMVGASNSGAILIGMFVSYVIFGLRANEAHQSGFGSSFVLLIMGISLAALTSAMALPSLLFLGVIAMVIAHFIFEASGVFDE